MCARTGIINKETLTTALQALDFEVTDQELVGMLHWADPQGDQRIGLRQFVRMFDDVQGISLPPTNKQASSNRHITG